MIIDTHAHIASWPTLKEAKKNLLYSMKKYGISYSLISNCDCSEFPSLEDRYPIRKISQEEGLKECLLFAKKHPDKIGVLVWINPHKEVLNDEFKKLIEENLSLIHGFKFHPFESQMKITNKKLIPYLNYIKELGMPLLVHTALDKYSSIEELGKIAKKYPSISFIAAHLQLCDENKETALAVLKENPNIFADTAWVSLKDSKKVLREIGINKICFGTDNPIDGKDTLANPMYEEYFQNSLKLKKKEIDHLLYLNGANLYKINY